MAIALTDTEAELQAAAAGFFARLSPTSDTRARVADLQAGMVPPAWKAVVDQGFAALHLPEAAGGGGGTLVDLAIVLEQSGRHLVPGPLLPTAIVGAVLANLALDPAATSWLERIASGAPAGLALDGEVVARPDGGGWVLDGRAGPVLCAGEAEVLLVPVTGPDGPTFHLVEQAAAGVEVDVVPGVDLTRSVGTATFNAAPSTALASDSVAVVRNLAATCYAAESLGSAQWCLETTLGYLTHREAFGRVVASFQALKHRLARVFIEVETMTAAAWDAAREPDRGGHQGKMAAAAAAVDVVGPARELVLDCLILNGGIGFTWDHDIHLHWRRVTTLASLAGAPDRWAAELGAAARDGQRNSDVEVAVDDAFRSEVRADLAAAAAAGPDAWRASLAAAGLVAPHYPKPYGRGATPAEQLAIAEEFAAAGVEQPGLVIGEWALPTILAHGSEDQRERLVPPTLRGEVVWCQLFSEPGSGSDLASLTTRAEKVDGGYRLNGQKVWTSSAHVADWGMCLARTDPSAPKHQGISYFLVDMASPGIDVRPLRQSTGAAEFNEVFLDDVFVPDDCLVGAENEGWRLARTTLANERVQMGGGMGFGLDLVGAFEGRAPSVPGDAALVTLGRLLGRRQALVAMGTRALLRRLGGQQPGAESSVLKVATSWHQAEASAAVLEWAGPAAAFASEVADSAQWRYLSVPSQLIGGGTSEIQLNVIAERVLGLPRS